MTDTSLLDKTILPFISALTAAKIFGVIAGCIVIIYIVRAIVYKRAMNLRRGPTALTFNLILAILFSAAVYTFFYWQWAVVVSVVISLIFMSATSHEVKEGNSDERVGVYGLNKDIRTVRGEIFNDMTIEKQLEYTSRAKEYKFFPIVFIIIAVAVPLLFTVIWHFCNIGYLYFPIILK